MDLEKIEGKIDRAVAGGTEVSMSLGGVQIKDLGQLLEISKMMSIAGIAVPYHLRGNPGACLAVAMRALRNGFDPFELAEHSYTMAKSQKNEDDRWEKIETIAFDSFVIRAIIDAHANITGVIRYAYEGEGDDRICIATCTPKGEKEPIVHRSPTLGALKAARGRNDKGVLKGSPLWETKPDQQQAYDTGRDLCRRYFPAVLLGWHDRDEMDENIPPERTIEPVKTSGLRGRLQKPKEPQPGFDAAGINKTIDGEVAKRDAPTSPVSADPNRAETERAAPEPEGVPAPVEGSGAAVNSASSESSADAGSQADAGSAGGGTAPPAGQGQPTASSEDTSAATEGTKAAAGGRKPPVVPTDGRDYLRWVEDNLPDFETPAEVNTWYKSEFERKLRNSLPNFTSEIADAAKAKATARVAELKQKKEVPNGQ